MELATLSNLLWNQYKTMRCDGSPSQSHPPPIPGRTTLSICRQFKKQTAKTAPTTRHGRARGVTSEACVSAAARTVTLVSPSLSLGHLSAESDF
jgi:hypothetical protein